MQMLVVLKLNIDMKGFNMVLNMLTVLCRTTAIKVMASSIEYH